MSIELTNKQYACIFFDLDHTLWDYEANSKETLLELFVEHSLPANGVLSFEDFHKQFKEVNAALWILYDQGKIGSETIREERFKKILETFDVHDEKLIQKLSHEYLQVCPQKAKLIPGAIETLEYLSGNGYQLSIITNGFEEIQHMKLTSGKLHRFFKHVITSQMAGHKKPARQIFEYALLKNNVAAHEAVMIGDNLLTDIAGARKASVDAIFFNPEHIQHEEDVTLEISKLRDLYHHL